jgi:hypothetical protein
MGNVSLPNDGQNTAPHGAGQPSFKFGEGISHIQRLRNSKGFAKYLDWYYWKLGGVESTL